MFKGIITDWLTSIEAEWLYDGIRSYGDGLRIRRDNVEELHGNIKLAEERKR